MMKGIKAWVRIFTWKGKRKIYVYHTLNNVNSYEATPAREARLRRLVERHGIETHPTVGKPGWYFIWD
jgi:hypothetical protein